MAAGDRKMSAAGAGVGEGVTDAADSHEKQRKTEAGEGTEEKMKDSPEKDLESGELCGCVCPPPLLLLLLPQRSHKLSMDTVTLFPLLLLLLMVAS
jgi:hypothetical protein